MKKSKNMKGKVFSFLCFALIGVGCGLSAFPFIDYFTQDEGNLFITLIGFMIMLSLMYCAFLLEIVIHELGHMVFGLLSGYRFGSFRVGSLMFQKKDGRLIRRRYSLQGTLGQALMYPPPYREDYPFFLYNAGGSVFNFLSSLLFLLLFIPFHSIPFLSSFLVMAASIALGIGLMNIIPLIEGNDGSNLRAIKGSQKERKCFWAQMRMNELMSQGVRLKDMEDEAFPISSISEVEGIMSCSALLYRENRLLDQERMEEALEIGRDLLKSEYLVDILEPYLKCDVIYLLLLLNKDRKEVDELKDNALIKKLNGMRGVPSVMREEYAYALLYEGNRDKAEAIWKEFTSMSKSYPYEAEIEGEKMLMERAEEGLMEGRV